MTFKRMINAVAVATVLLETGILPMVEPSAS